MERPHPFTTGDDKIEKKIHPKIQKKNCLNYWANFIIYILVVLQNRTKFTIDYQIESASHNRLYYQILQYKILSKVMSNKVFIQHDILIPCTLKYRKKIGLYIQFFIRLFRVLGLHKTVQSSHKFFHLKL